MTKITAAAPPPNDLNELMEKCRVLSTEDPIWIVKLGFGRVGLGTIKRIVQLMGRAVVQIGDGLTLLHMAAQYDRCDWIEYLAGDKGHPTEMRTVSGETPLDQASWKGHISSCLALLKFGASVDSQTDMKYTPLHRCAYYNHPQLAYALRLAGADLTLRDCNNQTAYEVAVTENNAIVARYLQPVESEPGIYDSTDFYALNHPNNPNYDPSVRAALFEFVSMKADVLLEDEDVMEPGEEDRREDEEEEEEEEVQDSSIEPV